jgi:hypothetical protein
MLNEAPLCTKSQDWLFHTTREPHIGMDMVVNHPSNRNIVVLSGCRIFQLILPLETNYAMLEAIYSEIIATTPNNTPPLALLTSLNRNSWVAHRSELLLNPENARCIHAIESAAFVICLDISAPTTPSERWTTFMLSDCSVSNRWYDRTLQFAVASNGVSSLLAEHSKLDGLSVRQLHEATTDAILSHSGVKLDSQPMFNSKTIMAKELAVSIPNSIITEIWKQQKACLAYYSPMACISFTTNILNNNRLRAVKFSPSAMAHITILFAVQIVYQRPEPVWETVSLAPFQNGRVDYIQTVTPAAADFISAAIAYFTTAESFLAEESRLSIEDDKYISLRQLLKKSITAHNRLVSRSAAGKGFVTALYHLFGAARKNETENNAKIPDLFRTKAWLESDRYALPKRVKTDCLGLGSSFRIQEGGFLNPETGSIYIHYELTQEESHFLLHGAKEDVDKFAKALSKAVAIMNIVC